MKNTFPLSALPILNYLPERRKAKERRRVMFIYICPVPKRIKIAMGSHRRLSLVWEPVGNVTDVFIPGPKPQESLAQILLLMSKKEQTEKCQLRKQIRENRLVRAQDFPRRKRSVPLCAEAELGRRVARGSTFSLASSLHCG